MHIPERTASLLDALVKAGRFPDQRTALETAVDQLYKQELQPASDRADALQRVSGALALGTTRASLRDAELDRLDFEGRF